MQFGRPPAPTSPARFPARSPAPSSPPRPSPRGGAAATAALALALALALPSARAVDTSEPAPAPAAAPAPPADRLADARASIARQDWPAAVAALKRVNDTRSADWHNLMGFALRKSASPDLALAERHYDEALRLNPRHLGALEYSGELYLMKGDLARAEGRLAELARACDSRCEEYLDLKGDIARFKTTHGGTPRS